MNTVSAQQLKSAFIVGARRLEKSKDIINELNVFPVPDGDTGTNMYMTVSSAVEELTGNESDDPKVICKAISQGSLRGARGNSGVILSQLFRGFYKVIKGAEDIDVQVLTDALTKATETAYKAVMRPKEGTILTIAKAISDKAYELSHKAADIDIPAFYDELVKCAEEMLEKTPDMLPVLKQAGVVDSGGTGLLELLKGASDFIGGRESYEESPLTKQSEKEDVPKYTYRLSVDLITEAEFTGQKKADLKVYLESIGNLEMFDTDNEAVKIYLFTNEPGKAITRLIKNGHIINVRLYNLIINKRENKDSELYKMTHNIEKEVPPSEMGFVAVSAGDGMAEIFEGLGADFVIRGGQTMNPSTEDILEAINSVNAKCVFVLPNNKNIILAAEQAKKLSKDKEVIVIPTTTIPQGITTLINYEPAKSALENEKIFNEEIKAIKSGEITYAIRDTLIEDKSIHKGDFMGISDAGVAAVNKELKDCLIELIGSMCEEESSLLSLYYGEDVSDEDAASMKDAAALAFPKLEIEIKSGGQPVYYYILSVE